MPETKFVDAEQLLELESFIIPTPSLSYPIYLTAISFGKNQVRLFMGYGTVYETRVVTLNSHQQVEIVI